MVTNNSIIPILLHTIEKIAMMELLDCYRSPRQQRDALRGSVRSAGVREQNAAEAALQWAQDAQRPLRDATPPRRRMLHQMSVTDMH